MKHTHRGHCQLCGRLQAARQYHAMPAAHALAQHGYKVAGFGFFNGTCRGSECKPLEEERSFCDDTCKALDVYAAEQDELAAAYKNLARTPSTCGTGRCMRNPETGKREEQRVPWEQATKLQQLDETNRCVWRCQSNAKGARAHAAGMRALADSVHGQPLTPRK